MRAIPSGRLAAALIAALAVVAVVIAGVMLAESNSGSAEAGPVVPKAKHVKAKYVALGSSFAAGPGEGHPVGRCGQTSDNYPRQVARALNMKLVDATCSGAVTEDILRPSPKHHDRAPQIDAVTPDTSLVTVTVGGNDVAYIGRIANMVCANLAVGLYLPPLGKYCNSINWPSAFPMPDRYQSVERSLIDVVRAVHTRAPEARVVLVDYLPVVSVNEGWCDRLPMEPWQVAETADVGTRLADATARAAQASGAQVVRTEADGAKHTICSADPWVRGYGQPMPFHPNAAGKRAMADEVIRALR
ncbi:SGNH/GDSL hydrolase family protein [Gordonia sp. (in: high G+C Gram-positive bacteria)]|uniref:SGNH/GDSL hydrolase family protein n=1 Tax=unclassified Gordonia (in: high G+C Gram-positive bacteria) TaxID=2657482 RepID=UPI00262124B1|nr:SGNH/GDSL hydrolase family protein [Gordonia sp. (in: high G+C Gram-positive bacteria)]